MRSAPFSKPFAVVPTASLAQRWHLGRRLGGLSALLFLVSLALPWVSIYSGSTAMFSRMGADYDAAAWFGLAGVALLLGTWRHTGLPGEPYARGLLLPGLWLMWLLWDIHARAYAIGTHYVSPSIEFGVGFYMAGLAVLLLIGAGFIRVPYLPTPVAPDVAPLIRSF